MQDERLSREEIIYLYQDDAKKLLEFYPWLEKVSGQATSEIYKGEGLEEKSMPVPVYDSRLLNFIKTAKTTEFMNRNYVYTYSRFRIKTAEDEIRVIESCTLQDMKVIGDILSKYCYKGDVRGVTWTEGVKDGVYLVLLKKMKSLLEIHTNFYVNS